MRTEPQFCNRGGPPMDAASQNARIRPLSGLSERGMIHPCTDLSGLPSDNTPKFPVVTVLSRTTKIHRIDLDSLLD